MCITYTDDEYGIALLPDLDFSYIDESSLISQESFDKLYKEVMDKISIKI